MENIKFIYHDLNDGNVLIKVDYFNKDLFDVNYYESWWYSKILYEVGTYSFKTKGDIDLEFNEYDKLIKVTIYLGTEETYAIIPKKYAYIFRMLEEKVYNIKEKSMFQALNIKKEDIYYTIDYNYGNKKFYIKAKCNYVSKEDIEFEKKGNVFKTIKGAEEFIEKLENVFKNRREYLLK